MIDALNLVGDNTSAAAIGYVDNSLPAGEANS
jgi:hypothetical protein